MKPVLTYLFGIVSGMILILGLQIIGINLVDKNVENDSLELEGERLGFSRGREPNFSIEPGYDADIFEFLNTNWTIISMEKEEIPFRALKGKVIFLNRWATWCGPCISEMPGIAELRDKLLEETDVIFLLITDEQERIVDAFENEYNLPLYVSKGSVPDILKGHGLPSTFIIDKDGRIRYQHAGMAYWGSESAKKFILGLDAQTPF